MSGVLVRNLAAKVVITQSSAGTAYLLGTDFLPEGRNKK